MHEIADATHIDDGMVGRHGIHAPSQFADHCARSAAMRACVPARWAWAIAQAKASAASAASKRAVGSSRFTMACTCVLSAWPTPTTDFLMWLGAYSAIVRPASAAASNAIARA